MQNNTHIQSIETCLKNCEFGPLFHTVPVAGGHELSISFHPQQLGLENLDQALSDSLEVKYALGKIYEVKGNVRASKIFLLKSENLPQDSKNRIEDLINKYCKH